MSFQADFASQDYFRNPAAALERLRAQGPVVRVHFPIIGQVWATTTQALADRVLKDTETFTIRKGDGTVAGLQWWMPKVIRTLANSMLSMDDPGHKRLRDIVDEAFRRRAVLGMEPHIQAIGDKLADELFAEGSPCDLVDRYARKLPLSVISELLGLPPDDRPKFIAWASGFTRFTGMLGFLAAIPKMLAMRRYMERHVETVRQSGGEGLIAEIVRVETEGGQISRDEIVAMIFLLLFAGHETTTHLISGSVHELLKTLNSATGSNRIGAVSIWRSKSSCGFSRRCNSPSRVTSDAMSNSTASSCARATRSWRCWRPPTWIRWPTPIRSVSICNAGRTAISPSAPAFISVSAISSRASKPNVR
jgi:cytochrome P450